MTMHKVDKQVKQEQLTIWKYDVIMGKLLHYLIYEMHKWNIQITLLNKHLRKSLLSNELSVICKSAYNTAFLWVCPSDLFLSEWMQSNEWIQHKRKQIRWF